MKELTKCSCNLFEVAFISPEGGEWSRMLGGMCLIQDCPSSVTWVQTLQRKIKTFRNGLSNLLICDFAKSSIFDCWMRLCICDWVVLYWVHSCFWNHSGYWANTRNAQRCKPRVDRVCRKSTRACGRPATAFWSWNLAHGRKKKKQNQFGLKYVHYTGSLVFYHLLYKLLPFF